MKTQFHMKGYAPRLALKKRYKSTRNWPIILSLPLEIPIRKNYTTIKSAKSLNPGKTEAKFHQQLATNWLKK